MKPKFHRSFDVQTLIDMLAKMSIGDAIPASKLAAATGDEPKSPKFYGKLASARRVIEREQRIVTTLDGGIVTRLADAAIVSTASDVIQRVRRTSLRGLKKLGCVDYDKLTNAEKTKHDASASHLGILAECSRPNTVAKIEAKVQEKTAKLTFDETLKAFRQ